jgi:hypothetical protein
MHARGVEGLSQPRPFLDTINGLTSGSFAVMVTVTITHGGCRGFEYYL